MGIKDHNQRRRKLGAMHVKSLLPAFCSTSYRNSDLLVVRHVIFRLSDPFTSTPKQCDDQCLQPWQLPVTRVQCFGVRFGGPLGTSPLEVQSTWMFGPVWPGTQLFVGNPQGQPGHEPPGFLQQGLVHGQEVRESARYQVIQVLKNVTIFCDIATCKK